jgi:hypothetical protein
MIFFGDYISRDPEIDYVLFVSAGKYLIIKLVSI